MQEKIISLFSEKLGARVLAVTDSSRGEEQAVYVVDTDRGRFVIKFPAPPGGAR